MTCTQDCPSCHGTGFADPYDAKCHNFFGQQDDKPRCGSCGGSGSVPCDGKKCKKEPPVYKIKIPCSKCGEMTPVEVAANTVEVRVLGCEHCGE